MIHSWLGTPASTQDFEQDYSTPEYELYEDDDRNIVLMQNNVMINQLLSHMTHTLVLR